MMRKADLEKTLRALLAATVVAALPGAAMAEPGSGQSLREAERLIARCLDHAASQKLTPLSVGVVDASGALVAFKRQDGASSATAEAALLKARTAPARRRSCASLPRCRLYAPRSISRWQTRRSKQKAPLRRLIPVPSSGAQCPVPARCNRRAARHK